MWIQCTDWLLVGWQLQIQNCCSLFLTVSGMLAKCITYSIDTSGTVTISELLCLFLPCAQIHKGEAPLPNPAHVSSFLVCRISDILPLIPSKSFTRQDVSMETKTKGTQRLCVIVSLWCWSRAFVLPVSFAVWHFQLIPQTCLTEKPPFPVSKLGNVQCNLCWVFSQNSNDMEAVHLSKARKSFSSKAKLKRKSG